MKPIEERMHKSETSHLAVHEHLRPPTCAEEATRFHKRVKIHVPMKIVVPCAVFKVEFPIPPDRTVHLGSYNGLFDDHMYAVASQRGLRCTGEVDKSSIPSIDIGRVTEQNKFEVCRNLFDGGTTTQSNKSGGKKRKNWKKRKRIKGGSSVIIDSSLLRWCQEVHSAQQMFLTTIRKTSSTTYC
uniref:Uncharacterized protein n=1 Tax=Brassica oleracea TaxID=3712 RepID=A0A3P6FPA4_BRAOL|nr:unnamed protein product [Brassica oleracea]